MYVLIVILSHMVLIIFCYTLIAEADAGVLRKKKFLEQQKLQENKLTIAQINYRLSELQDKRVKLEEEKQALLSQAKNTNNNLLLYLPAIEATWYIYYHMRFIVYRFLFYLLLTININFTLLLYFCFLVNAIY